MSTAEKVQRSLDLHRLSLLVAPITWERVQPHSKKNPTGHRLFTAERLRAGVSTLQCGRILGLSLFRGVEVVRIIGYVCSGHQAQAWYLSSIDLPLEDMFENSRFSCTCKANSIFCHHVTTLLLAMILIQTLPASRPKWCRTPGCLPTKTSQLTSQKFKADTQDQLYYEENIYSLLYSLTQPPLLRTDLQTESPNYLFASKQPKIRDVGRPQYKTISWDRAANLIIGPPEPPNSQPTTASSEQPNTISSVSAARRVPRTRNPSVESNPRSCRRGCGLPVRGHKRARGCPPYDSPSPAVSEPPLAHDLTMGQLDDEEQILDEATLSLASNNLNSLESEIDAHSLFESEQTNSSVSQEVVSEATPALSMRPISAFRERLIHEQATLADIYAPRPTRQRTSRF